MMNPKNIPYLVYDSVKALVMDLVELLESLKKAKTWSFILYATFFLAVYYRNYKLAVVALPLMIIIYIMRRQKEPEFGIALRRRAFLGNNEKDMQEYYESYKRQCYFTVPRKTPLSYEDYKKGEIEKLKEKEVTQ